MCAVIKHLGNSRIFERRCALPNSCVLHIPVCFITAHSKYTFCKTNIYLLTQLQIRQNLVVLVCFSIVRLSAAYKNELSSCVYYISFSIIQNQNNKLDMLSAKNIVIELVCLVALKIRADFLCVKKSSFCMNIFSSPCLLEALHYHVIAAP